MEFVGRRVRKDFKGFGIFTGVVKSYNPSSGFFKIGYEDGDSEEIEFSELASCLEEDEGVGDDHSHSQLARKKPFRVGRKPKKRRKVLGSSNSGNNNDSSACLVALVTSDNSNLESVGEGDLRDVVVSVENLSKNTGFNVSDNNVSSVCENANLKDGGLDLNRGLDDLNENVKGNDDGIDLNLDLNEEGDNWELKQKGSGNFGVKKEHCFDLNMGLDDDDSKDEDVDLGGYSKGNNGESKRRENCGGEVESIPVEGASFDKHLLEISKGTDPNGNLLANGGMDTRRALSTNFVTNGDSSENQKQDVSVAAASPVHDQQVTTGSAHTGRRRGRKRKKLADSVNFSAESVLRRSTRRRAKFSAEDHVPKTLRYDGENSTLLSPAVSAVSEEQPTISGNEESEEPSILPSKFELPPSSGHVNLDGVPALDLFSVYAFLRSFSTLLFLSPFELGDFVASLRSKSPNLLIDHIHVSLLQTLRKHLESQSGESSPSATNCLRDLNWDMLDLITWPIFMVEYLLMKPGFDLCHLKLFKSDYYKQPEFVKIEILQCLCDDVIEVEAIRSELNRRTLVGEPTTVVDSDRSTKLVSSRRRRAAMDVSGGCMAEEVIDETADWNSDECCLCKMDGNLICCDGCPAAFHSKCVGVATSLLPEGDWFCPECALDRENPCTSSAQSIRGAELLGVDPQGHLYYSSCSYLLVLDPCDGESSFHYYHMNDLTAVIEALKLLNGPYRTIASVITKLSDVYKKVNGEKNNMDSENAPLCLESLVKGQLPATLIAPVPWESSETCAKDETVTEERPVEPCMLSTYSSNLKHDVSGLVTVSSLTANPENIERPLAPEGSFEMDCSNKSTGVSGKPAFAGHLSLKSSTFNAEQGKNVESSNCGCDLPKISTMKGMPEELVTDYVNLYSFARVASSVAGEWTRKSSDKISSEPTKSLEELISAQMKAISKTSVEFCWSNIQNNVNAKNEKCGWCLYCKYPTDDVDCLFNTSNNAPVLEGFTGGLLGFGSRKDSEGRLVDVMCHILCIENRLHGLLVGPWLNPHFPKLYRKSFLHASDIVPVKNLLLMLESNIRALAFSAEWLKHVDSVNKVGSASHIVTSNRLPSRNVIGRKRSRGLDSEPRSSRNASSGLGLFWWRGGKLTRHLFNCKVLPWSLASKAARQGGGKKIQGILYPDNSDFAKRSRPLAWRASVESSVTVEQLALQVRELDANIRWDHIESTRHLLTMDKEYMKSMRSFKKAIIRRKCSEGDTVKYLLDFGKRRFIPDTVVKHGSKLEESSSERKKYWLEEPYVPLFMLKAFEERKIALKSNKTSSGNLPVSRRVMKKPFREEGFSYLYSRAERSENYQCGHCNKDVLIRDAVSCQFCEGFFHKRHVRKTSGAITADCAYTCHKCHGGNGNYAKIDNKKRKYSKSPKKASKVLKPVQSKITRKNGRGKQPVQRHKPQTRARSVVVVPLRRSARRAKIVALQSKKTEVRKKKQRKSANKMKQQKPVDQMNQPKGKRGRPRKHPRKDILQKRRTQVHSTYWLNGLLLSRKPDDDRVMHFRTKNHLVHFERLAAISDQPKCSLCCEAEFRPLLNYICCETCGDWFHGDAFGLKDEHIQIVIGFKCHKCRNRTPPICPHLHTISDKSNLDDSKNDEEAHGTDEISSGMGLANEALEKQKSVAAVEPKDLFLVDESTQKEPHVEPVLGLLGDHGADAQNGPVSTAMDMSTGATDNSDMKNLGPADTLIEPSENSSSNDILLASMAESTMSEYTKDASEKENSLTRNLVNDGSFRTNEATEKQSSDVNRTLVGSSEIHQQEATVDSGELDREL